MTAIQFAEWLAWAQLRGMPQDRADFFSGQLCAVLANINRKEDAKVFEAQDFIPPSLMTEPEEEEAAEPAKFDAQARSEEIARLLGRKDNGNAR